MTSFISLVLAQAAEAPAAVAATPWWVPLLLAFFGLLSSIVSYVIAPAVKRYLEAKQKAEEAAGQKSLLTTMALKAEHFAELTVSDLDATMKPAVAKALEDGKITDEEKAELRKLALERMKALFGQAGLAELGDVMGLVGQGVDHFLQGHVEKQVDKLNAAVTAAVATPVTPAAPANP